MRQNIQFSKTVYETWQTKSHKPAWDRVSSKQYIDELQKARLSGEQQLKSAADLVYLKLPPELAAEVLDHLIVGDTTEKPKDPKYEGFEEVEAEA